MTAPRTLKSSNRNSTPTQRVGLEVLATADTSLIRRETYNGSEHLVVPLIALIEGVLWPGNAPAPELALASEFGKFPQGWNGRPTVLDHPEVDGVKVSANSPDVLENQSFGMLFNTVLDGKKLKTEAWLKISRLNELGGEHSKLITRLESGNPVEVSTGLFTAVDATTGEFDGFEYEGVWRDVVPDHLAFLREGAVGACSVEAGCGAPRTNVKAPATSPAINPAAAEASVASCACGGCTMKAVRTQSILSTGPGPDGHTHTYGAGSEEDGDTSQNNNHTHGYTYGASETDANEEDGHRHSLTWPPVDSAAKKKKKVKRGTYMEAHSMDEAQLQDGFWNRALKFLNIKSNSEGLSDNDIRMALQSALDVENPDKFSYIVAVYSKTFIYQLGWTGDAFERDYTVAQGGTVTLGKSTTQVRPETTFVPVTVSEDPSMTTTNTKKAKVDALITNKATKYAEKHRAWLETLSEEQLDDMAPIGEQPSPDPEKDKKPDANAPKPAVTEPTQAAHTQVSPAASSAAPTAPKPVTLQDYIAGAPAEIAEVLNEGVRLQNSKRDALTKGILANKQNGFSEADLKAMSTDQLEKLGRIANVPTPDYSGRGMPAQSAVTANASDPDSFVAPPPIEAFPVKKPGDSNGKAA